MLKIDNVTKHFGSIKALNEIRLSIGTGTMVGIIGRSGSGKSTLLRLINRLIDPTSGRIEFDGEDIVALRGKDLLRWRSHCAMIFQQFNLVGRLDVLTNVLVGRLGNKDTLSSLMGIFSRKEKMMAIQALDSLDMAQTALQRAETLSGGQQQRVAIARALVQDPRLILADEPISSLDPHNAACVMDALRRINRESGITVVCNLHQLETARNYCNRIVGMQAGRIVFDGSPEDVSMEKAVEIYGAEADGDELREALGRGFKPESHCSLAASAA
jgi:phosphonate transport system ATP-binding protein